MLQTHRERDGEINRERKTNNNSLESLSVTRKCTTRGRLVSGEILHRALHTKIYPLDWNESNEIESLLLPYTCLSLQISKFRNLFIFVFFGLARSSISRLNIHSENAVVTIQRNPRAHQLLISILHRLVPSKFPDYCSNHCWPNYTPLQRHVAMSLVREIDDIWKQNKRDTL